MSKKYLITGGAGFIGSNYVHRLLKRGEKVTIYDNFARAGAPRNLDWLKQEFGENAFDVVVGDVRDASRIAEFRQGCGCDRASGWSSRSDDIRNKSTR